MSDVESLNTIKCNICSGVEFKQFGRRPNAACASCGSLERTRLLWMYLERESIPASARILHIAPERSIYSRILPIVGEKNYICADIDTDRYSFAHNVQYIDLTKLDHWPSNQFDYIIHVHVLEHIPCNYAYVLFHLHRMLKPSGRHICIIPFMKGKFDETFQDIGDEARTRRFGQFDHVRRFGADDVEDHLGRVVNLPKEFDAEADFGADALNQANIPANLWRGFSGSTVLNLKKEDYKLV